MTDQASYEDDDALAAEVALGVLVGAERTAAEQRRERDPAFAARVASWEARLSPLNTAYDPVSPPPGVKPAIEARLFGSTVASRRGWLSRLWGSAPFWRAASGVAIAAVAVLALMIARPELSAPGSDPGAGASALTLSFASEDDAVRLVVLYDRETGALRARRAAGTPPEGQDYELWIIAGDAAPVSLGVLGATAEALSVPDALRDAFTESATFAVTLEAPGGSPTGAPQGPIVAAGKALEI